MPPEVTAAESYGGLRLNLEAFAWSREESEQARHRARGGAGTVRSHYRCVLSFEQDMPTPAIRRMVSEWLGLGFPRAPACGFVHRNTEHVHVHVWIDARGIDGKKLDFTPKEWRQIGAKWDRLYQRELTRIERLEGRFKEEGFERLGGQQGGTSRDGRRASNSSPDLPAPAARLTPGEQAAHACAKRRSSAVRAVEQLRVDLERLVGRSTPTPPRDRDRSR